MTMRIGELKTRLTLQTAVTTLGEGGGASITWSDAGSFFAKLRSLSGREVAEADAIHALVTHEVILRSEATAKPTNRFALDSRVFDIKAVLDLDGSGRWLRCLCEEKQP